MLLWKSSFAGSGLYSGCRETWGPGLCFTDLCSFTEECKELCFFKERGILPHKIWKCTLLGIKLSDSQKRTITLGRWIQERGLWSATDWDGKGSKWPHLKKALDCENVLKFMSNLLLVYAISDWLSSSFYELKGITTTSSVSFPTSLVSGPVPSPVCCLLWI